MPVSSSGGVALVPASLSIDVQEVWPPVPVKKVKP